MRNEDTPRARLCLLAKRAILLAGIALSYAAIVHLTPLSIPCVFYKVTGLYCPGCGVSRMCLALLRLDIAAAFRANCAILLMLPFAAAMLLWWCVRYVRTGECVQPRWMKAAVWTAIAVLLVFGVLRNLPVFAVLAPH